MNGRRPGSIVFTLGILFFLFYMSSISGAENRVDVDIALSGVGSDGWDTIYVGGDYEFRFWFENDMVWAGLSTGFDIWSPTGGSWKYIGQPDGIGQSGYFTVVSGSRMEDAFDMTGLLITEYNVDMVAYDSVLFGGVALYNGLQPGPLEHMVSLHFRPTSPTTGDEIYTLCIDSNRVPPSACTFCYYDQGSNAFRFEWDNPICVPIRLICGNPNGDNTVNVGDAVFIINYIFRGGRPPDPYWLGDANCDASVNVGDAVFLISAIFGEGPQPECCGNR